MVKDVREVYSGNQTSPKIHLTAPFYLESLHLWVALSCTLFNPPPLFARNTTIGGVDHNTSSMACVMLDQTKFLDYKSVTNSTKELAIDIKQRLPSIINSYMFVADNNDLRLLHVPDILASNYNYSSVYSPELTRYTGFRYANLKENIDTLTAEGEGDYRNHSLQVAGDPASPSLVTNHQVHVRSKVIQSKPSQNKNYTIKYLFYFSEEHLNASMTLIDTNIKASQYQVTYLALIIIIIICALVMCISFK